MSEANVHVERPVGRYGKTNESPAKYGRVVDVSDCGRYWKFEYGQTRRIARWFAASEIELHPLPANAGDERTPRRGEAPKLGSAR